MGPCFVTGRKSLWLFRDIHASPPGSLSLSGVCLGMVTRDEVTMTESSEWAILAFGAWPHSPVPPLTSVWGLSLCPWPSTVELSHVTVSTWGQCGPGSHCDLPTITSVSLWLLSY